MRGPVTPGHSPVSAVCIVFTLASLRLESMGLPRPAAPQVLGMPRLPSVQGAAVAGLCPGRAVASLPGFLGPWLACGRDPLQEMPALGLTLVFGPSCWRPSPRKLLPVLLLRAQAGPSSAVLPVKQGARLQAPRWEWTYPFPAALSFEPSPPSSHPGTGGGGGAPRSVSQVRKLQPLPCGSWHQLRGHPRRAALPRQAGDAVGR